jgi:hypothetical protein
VKGRIASFGFEPTEVGSSAEPSGSVGGRRDGGGVRRRVERDVGHEPEPATANRADVALSLAVIAQGFANRLHQGRDRRIGDEAAAPEGVDHLLLGHHPVMVLDQEAQERERLGLHRNQAVRPSEFGAVAVEVIIAEAVDHGPGYGKLQALTKINSGPPQAGRGRRATPERRRRGLRLPERRRSASWSI